MHDTRGRQASQHGKFLGEASLTFAIEVNGLSLTVAHRDGLDMEDDSVLSQLVAKNHAGFRD